jgi:hypothetical protein
VCQWDKASAKYLDGEEAAAGTGIAASWWLWAAKWLRFVLDRLVGQWLMEAVFFVALFVPAIVPAFARLFAWTAFVVPRSFSHRADRAVVAPRGRMERAVASWVVAADCMDAALAGMREMFDHAAVAGQVVHFPITIEFSAADDVWLSPAFGQAVAIISIPTFKPLGTTPNQQGMLSAIADLMLSLGARPDWSSDARVAAASLRALYPRWDHFAEMRAMLDPAGMFVNPWVRRTIIDDGALAADTPPQAGTATILPPSYADAGMPTPAPLQAQFEGPRSPIARWGLQTTSQQDRAGATPEGAQLDADPAEAAASPAAAPGMATGGAWSRLAARAKAAETP